MLFAICGKSGAGKSTLRELLLKYDKSLNKVMSYTTRPIRDGEKVGDDYFFIDEKTYREKMNFIITRKAGNFLYGMTKDILNIDKGLMIIDIGGMSQLKKYSNFKIIFISPSENVLISRLLSRGDKMEDIKKRLEIDAEFTIDNVGKLANSDNILHIGDDTKEGTFIKAISFINKQKATQQKLYGFDKERE